MLRRLLCFYHVEGGDGRKHVDCPGQCDAFCCSQNAGDYGKDVSSSRTEREMRGSAEKGRRDCSCSLCFCPAGLLPRGGEGGDAAAQTERPRGRRGKRRQGCCIEWKTKNKASSGENGVMLTEVSRNSTLVGGDEHDVRRYSEKEKQLGVEVSQIPSSPATRAPPIAFHYPIWNRQCTFDPTVAEAQTASGQRLVWADPLRRTSEASFGAVTLYDRRGSQAQSFVGLNS
ncbi:uncharacterized protein P884DRAFT_126060 [Thermothelomyces heterothallicus CBS 202.75]|uniref:uncharacterized protein n=1 Tax=Thermothelomyces heterothallicus CBS 202.75 TaxID=1149848 RepID=UPI00374359F8